MVIDGTITEIMETFPPQLAVLTTSGLYHVAITEETEVYQQENPTSRNNLVPGMQVRIEGGEAPRPSPTGPQGIVATRIEIAS